MKKILLGFFITFAVFAQTSEYRTSFFNKATNQKLSGFSGYIYLVPQAETYPASAVSMYAVSGYDDYYYCTVPDGEYKIYIDLDKGGANDPVLYREKVWIGENRMTTMANQFYTTMTGKTDALELKKYTTSEIDDVSDFQKNISDNFDEIDSRTLFYDPNDFTLDTNNVLQLNDLLVVDTLIRVNTILSKDDTSLVTGKGIANYVKKSVDSLNTLNKLTNVAYKGQDNNFGSFTQTARVFNSTSAIQLNGTSINTTGTLSNVAYKGQNNNFTADQSIAGKIFLTGASKGIFPGTGGAEGEATGGIMLSGSNSGSGTITRGADFTVYGINHPTEAGNVLIRTANNAGSKLKIISKGLDASTFLIDENGNVGIKNASITEALNLTGNIKVSGSLRIDNPGQVRYIFGTTVEGSDDGGIAIAPNGGSLSTARGAYFALSGANRTTNAGNVYLTTASNAGAKLEIAHKGTTRISILDDAPSDVIITGNIKASGTITANYFYLGAEGTDGSWRIGRSGNNLVFERRESGSWVTKSTITP